ncbi:DMT family transporter [Halobacillus karajensis]|uniref:Carboxylate/amino acid/amine transporter n=1 Tax=Halobacillus karajensis TaxID=195088 RepID=A0A024P8I6_9BACI|nr:DMT family transporter [Halobacillus karajensis]CDQ21509.1 carboxylate/amino acid/amine transporter [Halobacillus karajensis]CDQ25444.1 carboxylate/amino acid/amine transporter [Halobacillus karajensis]CDQ29025.1 carboxylate/amino acid/amine transporter [Halobacillus karajensis]
MEKPSIPPYIILFIGVLSISTSAIFVKLAGNTPAAMIAFYRLAIAVTIMAPYVVWRHFDEIKQTKKKDWIIAIFSGIFLAFHFILWFESLHYTTVASSVVLVSLQPIFAFMGTYIFFKEKFTIGAILSLIITITGSVIIGWGDFQMDSSALFGDFLALLGAVTVTGYFLLGQNLRQRQSIMTYTFIAYGMAAITLLLYNLIIGNSFSGYTGDQWLTFLGLAIIPTFFGHTLFNWTLKWLSASTISMAVLVEPIGASILAYWILDEIITWTQWLGGSIILFGLMMFILSTTKKLKPKFTHESNGP